MRKLLSVTLITTGIFTFYCHAKLNNKSFVHKLKGHQTVQTVVDTLAHKIHPRLEKTFKEKGLEFPPKKLVLIALKKERLIEVWAKDEKVENYIKVKEYRVLGASGSPGPKLKQGDFQVPEGIYKLAGLNPNSRFHLSIKVSYPSIEDKKYSKAAGFTDPGGDIFIHGNNKSIGCLAIGDSYIEELFYLVAKSGWPNVTTIIMPQDLRISPPPKKAKYSSPWIDKRYSDMKKYLSDNRLTNNK